MEAYREIKFEIKEGIGLITLNRPEKRNALSLNMMREIISLLKEVKKKVEIRVLIIKGEGPVFSAGHDLSEMVGLDVSAYRLIFATCTEMMRSIRDLPQPVIAQVHGWATAAGCQLVATCDLAVAEENARLATPGVRIGLFCHTPQVPLSRAIGRKKAIEMLFTGQPISAREAERFGLINKVVPLEKLNEETFLLAHQIAQASPLTLALGKKSFYSQLEMEEEKAYAYVQEMMSLNALAEDAQEGISAFLQKRIPQWKGK